MTPEVTPENTPEVGRFPPEVAPPKSRARARPYGDTPASGFGGTPPEVTPEDWGSADATPQLQGFADRQDQARQWRVAEARRRSIYAAGGLDALLAAGEISPAVVECLR